MGRDAYLLRLALGRSADLPPDWNSLSSQYERVQDEAGNEEGSRSSRRYRRRGASQDRTPAQTYDEKGRPTDSEIRALDDKRCEAQNEVLKLAVAGAAGSGFDGNYVSDELANHVPDVYEGEIERSFDEDDCGIVISWMHPPLLSLMNLWADNMLARVVTLNTSLGVPFLQQVQIEARTHGVVKFLFAGLPSHLASTLSSWTLLLGVGELETLLINAVLEWEHTDSLLNILWLAKCFLSFFVRAPMFAFATLQSLHLIPANRIVPPLSSWNIFSSSSPFSSMTSLRAVFTSVPFTFFVGRLLLRRLESARVYFENYTASPHPPPQPIMTRGGRRHGISLESSSSYANMLRMNRAKQWLRKSFRTIVGVFGWVRLSGDEFLELDMPDYPYNVSDLNSNPASYAAKIVADTVTLVPRLLIDVSMYQTVALRFIEHAQAVAPTSNAAWFHGQLFPSVVAPFKDRNQLQKIGLCLGIKVANSIAMLFICSSFSIWAGRRFYGWGRRMPPAEAPLVIEPPSADDD